MGSQFNIRFGCDHPGYLLLRYSAMFRPSKESKESRSLNTRDYQPSPVSRSHLLRRLMTSPEKPIIVMFEEWILLMFFQLLVEGVIKLHPDIGK